MFLQEDYVISYESRKLKIHEQNYGTHDLELAAIIHALKMWRHYLIGRKFTLMSDNISLKYLFDQQNLNAHQARWLAFLSEYDFEIKHIKGKENKMADALSRNSIPHCSAAFSSYKTNLKHLIKEAAKNDEEYLKIKEQLETDDKGSYSAYSISSEDLLVYKNRLYIPDSKEVK